MVAFVLVRGKQRTEVQRDARTIERDQAALEHWCDVLSRNGRTVQMFSAERWDTPWRKRKDGPDYEAHDGEPTPDFQTYAAQHFDGAA